MVSSPDVLRALDLRQRSAAIIASATATLAEPRDPEVVARAAESQREWERRSAEDAEEAARRAPPPAPVQRQSSPPPAYVTRPSLDKTLDAYEQAVGTMLSRERQVAQWRITEAERRCAELEERLAALEGRTDARP